MANKWADTQAVSLRAVILADGSWKSKEILPSSGARANSRNSTKVLRAPFFRDQAQGWPEVSRSIQEIGVSDRCKLLW